METRPLTLVEATLEDGDVVSTLLQNAETVRLVGPAAGGSGGDQVAAVSLARIAEVGELC